MGQVATLTERFDSLLHLALAGLGVPAPLEVGVGVLERVFKRLGSEARREAESERHQRLSMRHQKTGTV